MVSFEGLCHILISGIALARNYKNCILIRFFFAEWTGAEPASAIVEMTVKAPPFGNLSRENIVLKSLY